MYIKKAKMAAILLLTVLLTATVCYWSGEIINQKDDEWSINFVPESINKDNIQRFKEVWSAVHDNYIDEVNKDKMLEGAISGIVESLKDPYSGYLTPKMMEAMVEEIEGTYYGIGVSLTMGKDGLLTVIEPFKGSPAEKAGVMPDDKIIEVGGQDVTQIKESDAIVAMVRGPEGTKVKIKFYRQTEHDFIELEIERQKIIIRNMTDEMLDNETGYILIKSFEGNVSQFFIDSVDSMLKAGMKGLIIDLRDNPGGMVNEAKKIADKILPEGIIAYTIDRQGNRHDYNSDEKMIDIPLVILINGRSASASEILSGAVKDYSRGKLVGTKTFGKGIVQRLGPIYGDAGLNITTAKYYLPSDICIHNIGIEPDVIIEPEAEFKGLPVSWIKRDKDIQLKKAIEILKEQISGS